MKDILKNKKNIYIVIAMIIIIGIISIFALRLNFSLMYSEHIRISIYFGEEYNSQELKEIVEETLGTKIVVYQDIETFKDAVSINVKDATDEQINALETKLREKYQIGENEHFIEKDIMPHLRGGDIVKPYVVPMIIVTVAILIYIGIRYFKLGVAKVVLTLLLRLIIAEALLLSIIAIARLPIGVWTMPVAIILYIVAILYTMVGLENK